MDGNGSGIQEFEKIIRTGGVTRAISTMDDVKCTYFKNFPNKIQWRMRLCDNTVLIILQRFFFTTRDALEAAKAAAELTSSDFTPKHSNRFSYVWTVTDERMDKMVIVRTRTKSTMKRETGSSTIRSRGNNKRDSRNPVAVKSSTSNEEGNKQALISTSKRVNTRNLHRNSGRARSSL
jgi:hypothetical protein